MKNDTRPIYIYKITDRQTNKSYIGKTKNPKHRIRQHRWAHKHQKQLTTSDIVMKNNDWYYEILESTDKGSEREIYHIQNTPNCVNNRMKDLTEPFSKKKYMKSYSRNKYLWQVSWGESLGNRTICSPNNLLLIDPFLFQE